MSDSVVSAAQRKTQQTQIPNIPDRQFYRPLFSPWMGYGEFAKYYKTIQARTLVSPARCYMLYTLAQQALSVEGDWFETGVYKGGTALLFAQLLDKHDKTDIKLHLFDTFAGMPETLKGVDIHKQGDFQDVSLEDVQKFVLGRIEREDLVHFHQGFVPETFTGLENKTIAFAHVDVDIYQSVIDSCEFIYPRVTTGGFMVFDDYGFPTCPGARKAVDEFFADKPEHPLVLPTGQALVFKSS